MPPPALQTARHGVRAWLGWVSWSSHVGSNLCVPLVRGSPNQKWCSRLCNSLHGSGWVILIPGFDYDSYVTFSFFSLNCTPAWRSCDGRAFDHGRRELELAISSSHVDQCSTTAVFLWAEASSLGLLFLPAWNVLHPPRNA